MRQSALASSVHVTRAERHYTVGEALYEAGDEWAAVCFFYAAYHYVKAALLEDPIFDDPSRCSATHPDLNIDDRHTDRHQIRKPRGSSSRGWGVNDLVLLLYRSIAGDYDRLHQASVSVRYRDGLPAGSLDHVRQCVDVVRAAHERQEIVAS